MRYKLVVFIQRILCSWTNNDSNKFDNRKWFNKVKLKIDFSRAIFREHWRHDQVVLADADQRSHLKVGGAALDTSGSGWKKFLSWKIGFWRLSYRFFWDLISNFGFKLKLGKRFLVIPESRTLFDKESRIRILFLLVSELKMFQPWELSYYVM